MSDPCSPTSAPLMRAALDEIEAVQRALFAVTGETHAAALGEAVEKTLRAAQDVIERQQRALENVRALAATRKGHGDKFVPGDWDHLLRFCEDAGVVASPLRTTTGTPEKP